MKTNFLKTKEDIIDWLDKYEIKNYTLVEDPTYGYAVNVGGEVNLSDRKLKCIPVKFNQVKGGFYCQVNQLTSLDFCPTRVGGYFNCENNKLISLEFCPTLVGGGFSCSHNKLASLEFCPADIPGHFSCKNNQLTSLDFLPTNVEGFFYCHKNPALGEFQNLHDFEEILRIQTEIERIKKEKVDIGKALGKLGLPDTIDRMTFKL